MTSPHRLVVVADDAGIDVPRNRGIVEAWTDGVVRGISVLANGGAVTEFARAYHAVTESAPAVDVGLHLNLTEGRSLSGPLAGLTNASGEFLHDKQALWDLGLRGEIDPEVVCREAAAQIQRLLELGLGPRFVNGHQHVHLLPPVAKGIATAVASVSRIRWVRIAGEPVRGTSPGRSSIWPRVDESLMDEDVLALCRGGWHAEAAHSTLSKVCAGIFGDLRGTDGFAGLDLLDDLSPDALRDRLGAFARRSGSGVTVELMTHPGDCEAMSASFSRCPARSRERDVLCDRGLPRLLAELGFAVVRFSDLDCAG